MVAELCDATEEVGAGAGAFEVDVIGAGVGTLEMEETDALGVGFVEVTGLVFGALEEEIVGVEIAAEDGTRVTEGACVADAIGVASA